MLLHFQVTFWVSGPYTHPTGMSWSLQDGTTVYQRSILKITKKIFFGSFEELEWSPEVTEDFTKPLIHEENCRNETHMREMFWHCYQFWKRKLGSEIIVLVEGCDWSNWSNFFQRMINDDYEERRNQKFKIIDYETVSHIASISNKPNKIQI